MVNLLYTELIKLKRAKMFMVSMLGAVSAPIMIFLALLKNLLTIPVSRVSLIVSKLILLFLWITVLTLIMWLLTLILRLIGQFEGLTSALVLQSLKQCVVGGTLLFLLCTPTMLITFLFKSYVPTIIFTT
ncbi:ABC transporter permease [Paenibacillus sp. MZ04-78.2]|uniref:ABC transporter permease n=1 Tax=Paenibacillus sp. MZ04-78.2 TaxID=2962034 RepID=UPI0035CB4D37